ncbi:hypothetical protein RUM43_012354 [Polyplax serrata]|uniref:Uncharacterized protein n=1 Tax=Polyplax serrata TaxID=468196 RepID=A0AAN8P7B9_POLSC
MSPLPTSNFTFQNLIQNKKISEWRFREVEEEEERYEGNIVPNEQRTRGVHLLSGSVRDRNEKETAVWKTQREKIGQQSFPAFSSFLGQKKMGEVEVR